jgi:hypothetical protein
VADSEGLGHGLSDSDGDGDPEIDGVGDSEQVSAGDPEMEGVTAGLTEGSGVGVAAIRTQWLQLKAIEALSTDETSILSSASPSEFPKQSEPLR